jgi:hypothetical protein
MTLLPVRCEPQVIRRVLAGVLSVAINASLFLAILLSGGRHDGVGAGNTFLTQLVLIEAPEADQREGLDLTPLEPTVARTELAQELHAEIEPPASVSVSADEIEIDVAAAPVAPPAEPPAAMEASANSAIHPAPTFVMPPAQKSALSKLLARLAEDLTKQPKTQAAWEQDGTQYSATLILERANDGTALERVVAQVSAADHGKRVSTRVILKRLAFSQFTQMVDHWDPMVQLHDDEIAGRFHSNSRFNVLYDSGAKPKFLGKVTTAARSFDMTGGKRESEIFRGGLETHTGLIHLPEALRPSEWAPLDANTRIHELASDTRIRFFADGSYRWLTDGAPAPEYLNAPSEQPVYFLAARGATLYVEGVVAGKILVYSPQRILIEGNLTYAHDPREAADSRDYLGLVSDRYIEVAPPSVTGPGDLEIDGAILAGRRFVVRDIDQHRSATLKIFGSLAAGSLSASEPRYATKIEYDERFERRRPPGFPSTNRFEVEDWDGQWVETSEQYADDAL